MGWTLVGQGWILSNTSRVTCLGPQGPQNMVPGGSRGPKNGHILPMMAIFAHRHLQRLQMGWTLVEQGWTFSNTSRVTCLGPQGPQKMAPKGSRGPKNGHILPMMAIFAHRHLQRLQMSRTLVEQGWTLSNTSMVTCLGPYCPKKVASGGP